MDWEAGGTKFVKTNRLILRNNFVHHNVGPGLWCDIDNVGALYESNRVEDNAREGIVHEISYAAVIRGNTVLRNGLTDPSARNGQWLWNAGIGVHASRDVEVVGNTVADNAHGIVGLQQDRSFEPGGPYLLDNLSVHDNAVTQTRVPVGESLSVAAGVVQDVELGVFARQIRFAGNRYTLGANPRPFAWAGADRTEAEWRAFGHDTDGTFARGTP
jgi:hypothetical protein